MKKKKVSKKILKKRSKPSVFAMVVKKFQKLPLHFKLLLLALILLAIAAFTVAKPIFVKADSPSVTLKPVEDAYVNRSDKNENYDFEKEIKADKYRSGYLKFNLSSLAGNTITKAELRVYISESSKATQEINFVPDSSWTERNLVYNNRPASAEVIGMISNARKGHWVTIDLTNSVSAHIGSMYSISVKNIGTQTDSMFFYSKDNYRYKPELIIQLGAPVTAPTIAVPSITVPTIIVPSISSTLPPQPSITSPIVSAIFPAQVLNLANWKETLPTGPSESPTEIKQPTLATYKNDPWFLVSSEGNGVRFRAPVNGVTTSGSGYPRSELREMVNNGSANASWSSTSGTHTMYLEEAFTAVPKTKKHVVGGQVHDANDDVIVIRLEYPKLFIDIGGNDGPTLDANYTLGKRFTVKFVVNSGQTKIYYNGSTTPAYTLSKSYSGAYFKAGAYTQSNCSTEGSSLCTSSNYGEVTIYKLDVTHQ